ncbi:MAG: thiol:disulfide interchange protein DsbA/DsbL [Legionellales bacterium]|nr:thiol:disulfide interchange protein DsbA/DsbL [Legionellales bacterium]
MNRILMYMVALVGIIGNAYGAATIQEGQHYQKLASPCKLECEGKVDLQEYFTFVCPSCYKLEQSMKDWLSSKPKNVIFSKIPLTLGAKALKMQAKGYYVAKIYDKEQQYVDMMFKKIHQDSKSMGSQGAILGVLEAIGIAKKDALQTLNSFSLEMKIEENEAKMIKSKIFAMPTIVIGGKYKTDPSIAGGFDNFWNVVDHIIVQVDEENKS